MNLLTKFKINYRNYWGLETQLDLYNCNLKLMKDAEYIKRFIYILCDKIEMKRFGDVYIVNFGEDPRVSGFSVTQLIETSLISAHFANQSRAIYLNIFSCKKYDPEIVKEFSKKYFEAKKCKMHVQIRK